MNKLHLFCLIFIITHIVATTSSMAMFRCCGRNINAAIVPMGNVRQKQRQQQFDQLTEQRAQLYFYLNEQIQGKPVQELKAAKASPEFKKAEDQLRHVNEQLMTLSGTTYV